MSVPSRVEISTGYSPIKALLLTVAVAAAGIVSMARPAHAQKTGAKTAASVLAEGDSGCHVDNLQQCKIDELVIIMDKAPFDGTRGRAAVQIGLKHDVKQLPHLLNRLQIEAGKNDVPAVFGILNGIGLLYRDKDASDVSATLVSLLSARYEAIHNGTLADSGDAKAITDRIEGTLKSAPRSAEALQMAAGALKAAQDSGDQNWAGNASRVLSLFGQGDVSAIPASIKTVPLPTVRMS